MPEPLRPIYPVYVPSKGRAENCLTAKAFARDRLPFRLVVEDAEHDAYAAQFGDDHVLVLPFRDQGSVVPARNWIKDHSIADGHARHWQFDDNIRYVARWYHGKRIRCNAGAAIAITEQFVDRYTNVAIAGMNYTMFAAVHQDPFVLNAHVYSATLFLNSLPHRWRGIYNEDTDICLQVLSDGWCTIQMNQFLVCKMQSMVMKGGNTSEIYHGDGRAKMARSLERLWPGVVETKRRFHRPQHVVKNAWKRFDTPLCRRDDIDFTALQPNEFGMKIREVAPVASPYLKKLVDRAR